LGVGLEDEDGDPVDMCGEDDGEFSEGLMYDDGEAPDEEDDVAMLLPP